MRVTYDAEVDMTYICFIDEINPGEAIEQVVSGDGAAVLDFDSQGRILGVELFSARRRLRPELMDIAEKSDGCG